MAWKPPFDDPIRLANGNVFRILLDAADHVVSLSPRETKQQHWKNFTCLLADAEKRGRLMMARIAIVKALASDQASPSERLRATKSLGIIK